MRETWYLFDSESNVISEGYETKWDLLKAIPPKDAPEGSTYCKVLEDDKCWYECLEEYSRHEVI